MRCRGCAGAPPRDLREGSRKWRRAGGGGGADGGGALQMAQWALGLSARPPITSFMHALKAGGGWRGHGSTLAHRAEAKRRLGEPCEPSKWPRAAARLPIAMEARRIEGRESRGKAHWVVRLGA